jgi:hypothetical protein
MSDTTTAAVAPPMTKKPATAEESDNQPDEMLTMLERRLAVINEYLDEAQKTLSPLEVNLAFAACDLMALLAYYREDLEQIRAEVSDPKQRLEWLHLVAEQTYKLSKQIHVFAETARRLNPIVQPPAINESDLRLPRRHPR